MTARERSVSPSLRRHGIAAALAVVLFLLAYDDGAYAPGTQATAGVVVWWAILLALFVAFAGVGRLGVAGGWIAAALAALAAWTLASALWSSSVEASVAEFNRTLLYLGVFLFVALVARPGSAGSWADGLALGISAIAFLALASRLFASLFSDRGFETYLPSVQTRLSFPVGYWNGLGIFCALAVPLLLRSAIVARSPIARGLALAPMPAIAADIYLASSRGAVATLLTGTIVFLLVSSRRWALVGAIAVAAAGSTVTIRLLLSRHELVDGPLAGAAAQSQGKSAAWSIALACLLTAAVYALGCRYWPARLIPSPGLGRVAGIAAVVLAVGLVLAAHPVSRVEAFKQHPQQYQGSQEGGFVRAHLLSGNGSGRWQFWTAALDEWRTRPWTGRGAGSYEAWWSAHGTVATFVKDAHSLYLETLAELGVLGLALLLALLVGGVAVGSARLKRNQGPTRVTNAALLAVVAAYAVGAGIDWMWELTVVSIVTFICLALLVGGATSEPGAEPGHRPRLHGRRRRVGVAVISIAAVLAVASEGNQLLAQAKIEASQSALARQDLDAAFSDAVDARDLQPWAATPYLQLAFVAEEQGQLLTASEAIAKATERAPDDWRLWLIRFRIEIKRGKIKSAVQALHRAGSLNPRSPLFAGT
jgi:hypothetical protein